MDTTTTEDQIERFIHEYREKCERRAHARARVRRSENAKKRVLALSMKAAETLGYATTSAQEREAYRSEAYERWSEEDVAAVLELDLIHGEIQADELRWETWRTRRADRRAEMNLR
jgi:hypothetical protein